MTVPRGPLIARLATFDSEDVEEVGVEGKLGTAVHVTLVDIGNLCLFSNDHIWIRNQ